MTFQKSKQKKGVKRAWFKRQLNKAQLMHVFKVLKSSNIARAEAHSKTLRNAGIFCSMVFIIIVTVKPGCAVTPVIMLGTNVSDINVKAEKAYTLFSTLALTAGKFVNTREGRTAVVWLAGSILIKSLKAASLLASPTYGSAAIAISLVCTAAYSVETIVGQETFVGADLLNWANHYCTKGYGILTATAILPKDTFELAIKLLEGMKKL